MSFPTELDTHALEEATRFGKLLPILPVGAYLRREYYHWTAEGYGCVDGQYNAVIALIGGQWRAMLSHDPRPNALGDQATEAAHTYRRNSHAFGIAVNGLDGPGVDQHNFGAHPIQWHELEVLCAIGAQVALTYSIDLAATVGGEPAILTHAEAAVIDDYENERWDLGTLEPLAIGVELTPAMRTASGDILRARTRAYKVALMALRR